MEVHAHTHILTSREKKWTYYFPGISHMVPCYIL